MSASQRVRVGVSLPKGYWWMMALQAHQKFSPGDDPWMPVELIKVTSPPKAYEGRGLQYERKVMKVREVMKGEKVMRLGPELEDSFRDANSQILHCLQSLLMNTSLSGYTKAASLFSPLHQLPTSPLDYASSSSSFAVSCPTRGYGSRSCKQKSKRRGN